MIWSVKIKEVKRPQRIYSGDYPFIIKDDIIFTMIVHLFVMEKPFSVQIIFGDLFQTHLPWKHHLYLSAIFIILNKC